jgi:hypothetical protein
MYGIAIEIGVPEDLIVIVGGMTCAKATCNAGDQDQTNFHCIKEVDDV